jgi:uncharacterized protein YbaR (Trm112 family)
MRRRLLDVVACPRCRGDLTLDAGAADADTYIDDGTLTCRGCARAYPVRHGVPVLLPERPPIEDDGWSFNLQWRLRFSGQLEEGHWLWGWDLSRISYRAPAIDCWHLDCGSGSGDHTRNTALQNPRNQVVGLDRSDAVYAASRRDRDITNLHYVRGDILQPPLRDASFKVLVAVGSLHASGDTRRALLNALGALQKGGVIAAWLYPNLDDLSELASGRSERSGIGVLTKTMRQRYKVWRRYYFFRDYLFMGRGHRLAPRLQVGLCKLVGMAISPFVHVADFEVPKLPKFRDRYRSNTFVLLDNISPAYQDRPAKQQVLSWFHEAGVNRVVHNYRRGGVYFATKG